MQKSRHYLLIETLMKRIRMDDSETSAIQQEFYRLEAGLSGEQKIKRLLTDFYFKSDFHIFYNFECKNSNGFTHQMDALLLTPNFLLVIEVKQISGTLFYKPSLHEFFRVQDQMNENFPNPLDQAYRHQLFLEHQLKTWQLCIPVYHIVVLANYRAKLDESLNNFPIMHMSGIPRFIERLYKHHPKPRAHLTILQKQFQQLYEPLPPRRTIEKHRLRTGVLCKQCDYVNEMHYKQGYFICPVCGAKSKEALYETLLQYRILVSPRISNKAFREFFNIPCIHIASKLLAKAGLEKHGTNKGTYYIIPEKFD
ncbi:nuclease-related domain-containing protein [Solibacillus sp. FSL W8-0474]|uniref:nuclease-related domain-containing protein n=1 Tax=Solibacillus sp. FSL W8-0474 TaxID=2975336 RepID=UPI0030FA47ED